MRIVDFLHSGGGGGGGDDDDDDMMAPSSSASTSTAAASPRSLLFRWLLPFRKPSPGDGGGGGGDGSPRWYLRKNKNKKKREGVEALGEGGEVVGPLVPQPAPARDAGAPGVMPPESSSQGGGIAGNQESCTEQSVPSGLKPKSVSFNLGTEACLVLLLARSATESSKMIELHRQMETLLKEIKDEVQRKVTVSGFSESNSNIAFPASDCCDGSHSSKTFSLKNYRETLDPEEAKRSVVSNGQSDHDTKFETRRCPKMDQLELELEIELERLQFNLEGEGSSALPGPCQMELARENTDPFGSASRSFGEANERNEEHQPEVHGVNAWELERRLHELLEARQRERIAELESALECTERRLREKEIEVSWWRDRATEVSH